MTNTKRPHKKIQIKPTESPERFRDLVCKKLCLLPRHEFDEKFITKVETDLRVSLRDPEILPNGDLRFPERWNLELWLACCEFAYSSLRVETLTENDDEEASELAKRQEAISQLRERAAKLRAAHATIKLEFANDSLELRSRILAPIAFRIMDIEDDIRLRHGPKLALLKRAANENGKSGAALIFFSRLEYLRKRAPNFKAKHQAWLLQAFWGVLKDSELLCCDPEAAKNLARQWRKRFRHHELLRHGYAIDAKVFEP